MQRARLVRLKNVSPDEYLTRLGFVNRGFKRDIGEKTKPKARRADFFKGNDNSKNFDYHIEKYDHIFDLTINQHGFSLDIFLNLNSYTQKKLPICK